MRTLPFQFPLFSLYPGLAFGQPTERFGACRDPRSLTVVSGQSLKPPGWTGTILIDATGRTWEIQGVSILGTVGSPLQRLWRTIISNQQYEVAFDFVERAPMPLEEVKARVCASIDDNRDDWRDDEAIAGEDGPPRDEEEMLEELKTAVRNAGTAHEILENFEAAIIAQG